MEPDPKRAREAGEALAQVARDAAMGGDVFAGASASSPLARLSQRLGGHFAGVDGTGQAQDGSTDPVELWAKRLGRALSFALTVFLFFAIVSYLA